jgi:hypothetical protein
LFHLGPETGETYPLDGIDLWVFVRFEGDGEHEFWVEVMRLLDDGEEPELVTAYGLYRVPFGPERIHLSRAWKLRSVSFPVPGWYEFRLTGADEILAAEQIYLGE